MGMYSHMMRDFVPPSKEYNERFQEALKVKKERQAKQKDTIQRALTERKARFDDTMKLEKMKLQMKETLQKSQMDNFSRMIDKIGSSEPGQQQMPRQAQAQAQAQAQPRPTMGEPVMSLPGGAVGDFRGREVAPRPVDGEFGKFRGEQPPSMFIKKPTMSYGPSGPSMSVQQIMNPEYTRFMKEKGEKKDIEKAVKKEKALKKVKGMPAESAGKFAALKDSRQDIKDLRSMLFNEKGELDIKLATLSNIPGSRAPLIGRLIPNVSPFHTKAIKINSRMENILSSKLRIETGATATEGEVDNLIRRFGISFKDTTESAKDKLNRLERFIDSAIVAIDPSGVLTYKTGDKSLDDTLNTRESVTQSGVQFTFKPIGK